jgi:hypothetical protein
LGASTDRLAFDRSGKVRLLEIKNPANSWKATSMDQVCQKQSCLVTDGTTVSLNTKHDYFTQIQCQMHVYDIDECDFVLCTKSLVHVQTIKADSDFITKTVKTAEAFFDNIFLPEIVFPRVKFGLDPIDLRQCSRASGGEDCKQSRATMK